MKCGLLVLWGLQQTFKTVKIYVLSHYSEPSTPQTHTPGSPDTFVPSAKAGSGPTFLLKAGPWEVGLQEAPRIAERYRKARPHGPLNTGAKKLRPVQLALVTLSQVWIGRRGCEMDCGVWKLLL